MESKKEDIERRISELEQRMGDPLFWNEKEKAQEVIKEYNELKEKALGVGAYEKGNAILTIFSGAGGDDAEDFSRMLFGMYGKLAERRGWGLRVLHKNENDHGGFRNITFEVGGKGAYGALKNESGVHRLVRISPFSAKKLRHTSFSMVEVIPDVGKGPEIIVPESDLKIEFARSSGPGGQNVNKRDTAVRIVHIPTNLSAHVETERSQAQNKERAIELLKGKLYRLQEEERLKESAAFHISKTTQAEWGSQIRSYVLHPYKMAKDHRTNAETRDVLGVLERGELDEFIEAEKNL